MDVKIVEKEAMKVIGMEVITTMKNNTIPQLWDRFNKVCCSINNVKVKNVALGICPPVNMKEFDENTPFSYIAGLIVENFDDVPKEMVTYEIPNQKYAVITHKGALDNLNETYKYFYSVWPKESGREFSGGAEFEWYDERFKWGDPASEIDIYRPIK